MTIHNWLDDACKQWDQFALDWSKNSLEMWETGSRQSIIPFFIEYVPSGAKVADLGCGDGYGSMKLASLGYHVTGLDLSSEMIEIAHAKTQGMDHISFVQGDLAKLPFRNQEYDAVLAINSLEWTENPLLALKEMHRVVKQGGYGCIGILGPTAMPRKKHSYPKILGKDVIMNTLQSWDLEKLASDNGWEIIADKGIPKRGVDYTKLNYLAKDLQQSLSFTWLFMLRKK
ncbi:MULTISPECIES: class I SAM-dependent methyltransferase [Bacillaceae]|uniref:Ubiquinone/menaquinone biosynthesis C-methylase UbiE n=1 Tax=Peribacillus huizhouensis TaxID=1501239 RepID=A0ABR6CTT0_9BACI|nr:MULTISPECIES: class I SAM-dependent methyltransferase [Bacillaceae]MBA9027732.1 ubiquinone/menaquinone biosynthesis C-methylase UbiE [Peribacillus huizhouensis]